jgi:hypothetical protein
MVNYMAVSKVRACTSYIAYSNFYTTYQCCALLQISDSAGICLACAHLVLRCFSCSCSIAVQYSNTLHCIHTHYLCRCSRSTTRSAGTQRERSSWLMSWHGSPLLGVPMCTRCWSALKLSSSRLRCVLLHSASVVRVTITPNVLYRCVYYCIT